MVERDGAVIGSRCDRIRLPVLVRPVVQPGRVLRPPAHVRPVRRRRPPPGAASPQLRGRLSV